MTLGRRHLTQPYKRSWEKRQPTANQRKLLRELASELGREVPEVATQAEASDLIAVWVLRLKKRKSS